MDDDKSILETAQTLLALQSSSLRSRHLKNKGQSSSTAEPLDKAARELTTKEGGEDHLPSEATAVVLPQHPEPLTGKGALGGKL